MLYDIVKSTNLDTRELITRTGLEYRGKGLPQICELAWKNSASSLYIWSNKGYCTIKKAESMKNISDKKTAVAVECSHSINGTIIYWTIPLSESNE